MGNSPISTAKEKSFSFVIPCFNARKTIAGTLDSIRAQTVQPTEVIVVDDGSTDDTVQFLQLHYPEVCVLRQANAGPAAARNRGVEIASGDWIAFIDADDLARPNRLELQQSAIDLTNADLVCGRLTGIRTPPVNPIDFKALWRFNVIAMSSVCVKRSVILEAGGFSTEPNLIGVEDYHLWLRLLATKIKVHAVEQIVGDYMPGPTGLVHQLDSFFAAEQTNANWMRDNELVTSVQFERKLTDLYEQYADEAFHAWNVPLAEHCYWWLLRRRIRFGALIRLIYIYSPFRMVIWRRNDE